MVEIVVLGAFVAMSVVAFFLIAAFLGRGGVARTWTASFESHTIKVVSHLFSEELWCDDQRIAVIRKGSVLNGSFTTSLGRTIQIQSRRNIHSTTEDPKISVNGSALALRSEHSVASPSQTGLLAKDPGDPRWLAAKPLLDRAALEPSLAEVANDVRARLRAVLDELSHLDEAEAAYATLMGDAAPRKAFEDNRANQEQAVAMLLQLVTELHQAALTDENAPAQLAIAHANETLARLRADAEITDTLRSAAPGEEQSSAARPRPQVRE